MDGEYLDYDGVSRRLAQRHGRMISAASLRTALMRARRRRAGDPPVVRASDMPEPDVSLAGHPGWAPETIDAWAPHLRRGRPPKQAGDA